MIRYDEPLTVFKVGRCSSTDFGIQSRCQSPANMLAWPIASETFHPGYLASLYTWTVSVIRTQNGKKNTFEKNVYNLYLFYSLIHFLSANIEETGFTTYTAASHQGAIKTLWGSCYFVGLYVQSLWSTNTRVCHWLNPHGVFYFVQTILPTTSLIKVQYSVIAVRESIVSRACTRAPIQYNSCCYSCYTYNTRTASSDPAACPLHVALISNMCVLQCGHFFCVFH